MPPATSCHAVGSSFRVRLARAWREDGLLGKLVASIPIIIATLASSITAAWLALWPGDSGTVAALVIGGLAFAAYTPVLAKWAGGAGPGHLVMLAVWGVTFPGWGLLLGMLTSCVLGHIGWPHGLITGLWLWRATGSRPLGIAVALMIIPTQLCVWLLARACDEFWAPPASGLRLSQDFNIIFPWLIVAWNVGTATALTLWSLEVRGRELLGTEFCRTCGYDLRGLRTSVCPECGAAVPASTFSELPTVP